MSSEFNIKVVLCSDSLMAETPEKSAPRRLMPTSEVKLQNSNTQNSISSYKPVRRVLDFSLIEGNDDLDITADKIKSTRASHEFHNNKDAEQSVGLDTRHDRSSSMLGMVNVIHSLFCSLQRNPITKEELLQKIVMHCLDFVDIREVEEQLEILENLVPGWIYKKLVPSGDIMYCIKEVYDLDWVRARVSEM